MFATVLPSVADRIALTLDGLGRAVAARIAGGAMAAAMIVLIWGRLRRIDRQIQGLLSRFRAGRLRLGSAGTTGAGAVTEPVVARRSQRGRLPRRFGWLLPMVPYEAASFASQLRGMLDEPEMAALLAASGQARRVLAPLCRMLGIEADRLLSPAEREAAAQAVVRVETSVTKRVRTPRAKPDWGRIPLPRGVLAAARRQGFGKV